MLKKGISLFLALLICIAAGGSLLAVKQSSEVIIQPFYSDTNQCSPTLSISNGSASCSAKVTGKSGTTKITGTAVLYRIESGKLYTYKTWSNLSATGDTLRFSGTQAVTRGYTYRLVISATIHRSGGSESISNSADYYAK